jgi:hypothetical protein
MAKQCEVVIIMIDEDGVLINVEYRQSMTSLPGPNDKYIKDGSEYEFRQGQFFGPNDLYVVTVAYSGEHK